MKIDEIIAELESIRGKVSDYPGTFHALVVELAYHVKAQEPEELSEEEVLELNKEGE